MEERIKPEGSPFVGLTVMGMDPSSYRNCGWAVIRLNAKDELDVLLKETQKLTRDQNDYLRYDDVYKRFNHIVAEFKPHVLCLERSMGGGMIFVRQNLSETVGVVKMAAATSGVKLHEVSPGTLKKLIAGHGHAKKKDIMANITAHFGLTKAGPEHECDAVSCAMTYLIDLGWKGYSIKVPFVKKP